MPVLTPPNELRAAARNGDRAHTTAGQCPAHQQANLVILPKDATVAVSARVELMITHEPGQMFVTDLPRDANPGPNVPRPL